MKKFNFLTGLLIGIGLSACSVTFAASNIEAFLFPSKVIFHLGELTNNVDVSKSPVINHNNQAYVPLRLFAESIGARVNFQEASNVPGTHQIDIYTADVTTLFHMPDPEGYVTVGQFQISEEPSYPGRSNLTGLMRINKKMTGKSVQIDALDSSNHIVGSTGYIFTEMLGRKNEGDVMPFAAPIDLKGNVESYQVKVVDGWEPLSSEFVNGPGVLSDFAGVIFGPPDFSNDRKSLAHHGVDFKNDSSHDIWIEPLNMEYQIVKVDGDQEEIMFHYKIPALEGRIQAKSWFKAYLPEWNLRDPSGEPITPGKYIVRIQVPAALSYTVDGSEEVKMFTKIARYNNWEIDITQADIDKFSM
ncbi:hypothetical protein [Paenibacillus thalictri]|uniref:Copper amine oxidase-like N-terminal domain-containing protein n=1 Tax=Paenibacillus thalictri TaxID=2527873 RepID=A0A4Q9DNE2_9BACL|nr:hypothetical protein [Paenibacillus thalictri]TBL75384.1 hypothetical protein EYB31_23575 [Paenibacillus thalictri]